MESLNGIAVSNFPVTVENNVCVVKESTGSILGSVVNIARKCFVVIADFFAYLFNVFNPFKKASEESSNLSFDIEMDDLVIDPDVVFIDQDDAENIPVAEESPSDDLFVGQDDAENIPVVEESSHDDAEELQTAEESPNLGLYDYDSDDLEEIPTHGLEPDLSIYATRAPREFGFDGLSNRFCFDGRYYRSLEEGYEEHCKGSDILGL